MQHRPLRDRRIHNALRTACEPAKVSLETAVKERSFVTVTNSFLTRRIVPRTMQYTGHEPTVHFIIVVVSSLRIFPNINHENQGDLCIYAA